MLAVLVNLKKMEATSPHLKTQRLTLSMPTQDDVKNIVQFAGDYQVFVTTSNIPHPYKDEDAFYWLDIVQRGFEEKKQYTFAVRLNNEMVGAVGLKINQRNDNAILGYWLGLPFWNRGYTTEAAKRIVQFGFEAIQLHKIHSTHFSHNLASGRVMQKIGMYQEGILKEHVKKEGQYRDLVHYGILKSDYYSSMAK